MQRNRQSKINIDYLTSQLKDYIKENQINKIISMNDFVENANICALYACSIGNNKFLKVLNENHYIKLNTLDGKLLYTSILHNQIDTVEYLLSHHNYDIKELENACVFAVKRKNKSLLNLIFDKAKSVDLDFNLAFKNNVCVRIAISQQNLDMIGFLNQLGVSPLKNTGVTKNRVHKHLFNLIIRNKEDWIDYYLDNNILRADHLINHGKGVFSTLIINNILNVEKYENGIYYATKIIEKMKVKKNSISELKKLFHEINYIYPDVCGAIIPFRENLRITINHEVMLKKIKTKENTININRKKI